MGKLAELIRAIATRIQGGFFDLFDRKIAFRIAAISAITTLIVGAYAAINAVLAGLSYAMPDAIDIAASWVVPSNFDECVTAIVSAYVIRTALDYKVFIIKMSVWNQM